jgi:hypothetical protein
VSTKHLAAGVLLGIGIEFEFESASLPILFLNMAKSPLEASFPIPEGFEQIARGREAHPGFP